LDDLPIVRHGRRVAARDEVVVLVEGRSDLAALETLARRVGRDLAAEGVSVVPMGGATNIGAHVRRYGGGARLLGLCDAGEAPMFEKAGIAPSDCFVCVDDLEDELIRALGADAVLSVVEAQGQLRSFRTMQKQPAQRGRPVEAQLRRFFGSHSGYKLRYARSLVEALDLGFGAPAPLTRLLARLDR
jgi:hypothetical protein